MSSPKHRLNVDIRLLSTSVLPVALSIDFTNVKSFKREVTNDTISSFLSIKFDKEYSSNPSKQQNGHKAVRRGCCV